MSKPSVQLGVFIIFMMLTMSTAAMLFGQFDLSLRVKAAAVGLWIPFGVLELKRRRIKENAAELASIGACLIGRLALRIALVALWLVKLALRGSLLATKLLRLSVTTKHGRVITALAVASLFAGYLLFVPAVESDSVYPMLYLLLALAVIPLLVYPDAAAPLHILLSLAFGLGVSFSLPVENFGGWFITHLLAGPLGGLLLGAGAWAGSGVVLLLLFGAAKLTRTQSLFARIPHLEDSY